MPLSITPTLRPKRNKTQQQFWANMWPRLKEEGWDYDGKRFFYPPESHRAQATKRRRAGCGDTKVFFSGVGEITEYIRVNGMFIDPHVKVVDASVEEHKSSGEVSKKKAGAEKAKTIKCNEDASDIDPEEAGKRTGLNDASQTPYSSPKPEPSAPTPKTSSFRLNAAWSPPSLASDVSPASIEQSKKEKKSNVIKLRVVPLKDRKSKKKSMSMDSIAKQYVCDRCGRTNFVNGHALGGHKKYCSKPEYNEARERAERKSNGCGPKRKRSASAGNGSESARHPDPSLVATVNEGGFNLHGITNSIRDFADRVDDLDEAELDEALNTSDLFELQVIQTVLREERARISGRLAGMASISSESLNEPSSSMMISSFEDFLVDHEEAEEIREEQKAATPEEIAADLYLENSVGSDMAMSLGF